MPLLSPIHFQANYDNALEYNFKSWLVDGARKRGKPKREWL